MEHNSDFKYDLIFGIEGELSFADLVNKKVEVKRMGAHWQWISGRPYTEKKQFYGKRK